ncbi:MAG: triose-phosphate isomerase [Sphingomonadaceae bacterium]
MALIVGNWKMHGLRADLAEVEAVAAGLPGVGHRVGLCPPLTLLAQAAGLAEGTALMVGAQDVAPGRFGAMTGDVSAVMLKDAGARLVIVGHSERRQHHGETDAMVRAKAEAALAEGLMPIICVGETEAQRDAGETLAVLTAQLVGSLPAPGGGELAIAYEPVWAIGTGRTPTSEQVAQAHAHIAAVAGAGLSVLYGGSVKPGNAAELLAVPGVGGLLVGGASLKAADFLAIVNAGG